MLDGRASINQFYGDSHTLWDVDLDVPEGGCVCLMGRNGVGKTTLLKVIMGLLPAASGSDQASATPSSPARPPERARARRHRLRAAGARDLPVSSTVEENLRIGLAARERAGGEIPERVFDAVPGAEEDAAPARRRSLGRPAAAAGHRARAGARPEAADPRRADRGHPAQHRRTRSATSSSRLQRGGLTVLLVEQKLPFARRVGRSFVILDRGHRRSAGGKIADLTDDLVRQHLTV